MKLLVCGKGGCGKSTTVALLAREMASRGKRVLAIDSDESNFGLHWLLGVDRPVDFMEHFGGKKLLFERVKTLSSPIETDQIPAAYLTRKGNIRLLAIGKIYDFGEGCACPINALSAKLLENLALKDDEFLIADTDAGVEHLGRGVERGCDAVLVVVEPSRESIELAERITAMVSGLGKEVYYVLNKTDEKTEATLADSLPRDMVIGSIPNDRRILERGLSGSELDLDLAPIGEIADFLAGRAERLTQEQRSEEPVRLDV